MARSSLAVRLHSAGAIVARAATVAVMLLWPSALFGQTWQVVEYYDTDAVGSIRVVTDAQGHVVARHDFLPFGEELSPQTPPHDKKLYTGQERDFETGQDYFGARYYRAEIGRFTTIDPAQTISENLTDPQRWNRYVYVQDNPLRYVDPDGRYGIDVHYYLTFFLAAASGHSYDRAEAIARADLAVDIEHNPTVVTDVPGREQWHFPDAGRMAEVEQGLLSSNDVEFGQSLHVYQDSVSHARYWAVTGHWTKGPDQTYENQDRDLAMAKDVFDRLAQRSGRSLRSLGWSDELDRLVKRFLEAKTDRQKMSVFYDMREYLLREQ